MKGQWKAAAVGMALSVLVTCAVRVSAECGGFFCGLSPADTSEEAAAEQDITLREAGRHLAGPR